MDKRESEYFRFDGEKFSVWKFHMEICFEDKDVMPIVNGTIPKPKDTAPDDKKLA